MTTYQRFFIGGAGGGSGLSDAGLLILRLFTGIALAAAHGLGKLPPSEGFVGMIGQTLPIPIVFAWMSGIAETVGGLLLAIGLITRPAALLISLNMVGALTIAHLDDPFLGMEKALLFFFVAFMFVLAGAGRYSADELLRRRVDRHTVSRFVRG